MPAIYLLLTPACYFLALKQCFSDPSAFSFMYMYLKCQEFSIEIIFGMVVLRTGCWPARLAMNSIPTSVIVDHIVNRSIPAYVRPRLGWLYVFFLFLV